MLLPTMRLQSELFLGKKQNCEKASQLMRRLFPWMESFCCL